MISDVIVQQLSESKRTLASNIHSVEVNGIRCLQLGL